jgi:hypothetical protein
MHSTFGAWKEQSFEPRWRYCCERICVARPSGGRTPHPVPAVDLAADVADDPAQPATQNTQLPPELFGMGVSARHHLGGLGGPKIGLPQPDAVPSRQAVEPLNAACSSFASVGKVMAFRCTVVSTVARLRSRLRSAPAHAPPQALGQQQLQFVAEPLAAMAQVRALVRQGMLEKLS